MVDSPARFEIADNQGSTIQGSGSVGVIAQVFPDPAQTPISEFLISCPEGQDIDNRLLVSTNGSDFMTLAPSGHLAWTPKGGTVTQLTIKGNIVTGVLYEIIMNLEVD
tara:strand:+ start:116 stop:439 length:324 start_codon:yes stop_codon:yes gene_type:complete